MTRTIDVEVDEVGSIRPVAPEEEIPRGRAKLTFELPANPEALLSERALAEDWLRPEEDEAWQHLQPAK
jgi:hypothetical protein